MKTASSLNRQPRACPGVSTVFAAEEVPILADAKYFVRRSFRDGNLKHATRGRVSDVQTFPVVSEIAATEQRTGFFGARRCATATGSSGQVYRFRIVRRDCETSAVRAAGKHLTEPEVLPVRATVGTSERRNMRDYEHAPRRGWAEFDSVEVYGVIIGIQPVCNRIPTIAAVSACQKTANLDCGVDVR